MSWARGEAVHSLLGKPEADAPWRRSSSMSAWLRRLAAKGGLGRKDLYLPQRPKLPQRRSEISLIPTPILIALADVAKSRPSLHDDGRQTTPHPGGTAPTPCKLGLLAPAYHHLNSAEANKPRSKRSDCLKGIPRGWPPRDGSALGKLGIATASIWVVNWSPGRTIRLQ
jgi:hypothetical protein